MKHAGNDNTVNCTPVEKMQLNYNRLKTAYKGLLDKNSELMCSLLKADRDIRELEAEMKVNKINYVGND